MEKRIRRIEVSDASAVRDIYAPFVSDNATSFEAMPPDIDEMERRILELHTQYPWLVFESSGKISGYAYASPHRSRHAYQWCVDVSVYIESSAHHRGMGRALYTALFELLRRQGYVNAYAGIAIPNPASVGLHEAMGFTPIGIFTRTGYKLGKWHDVVWLQLRLLENPVPIDDPLPARELFSDGSIAAILQGCAEAVRLD